MNRRKRQAEDDRQLVWLVLLALTVLGGGLITAVFGPWALLTALPILLAGGLAVWLLYRLLLLIEQWLDQRH